MCLGWHRLTSMQLLVSKIPWFSNFFLFFSFILGERASNQLLIEENWSILEIEKNCISVFIFINIASLCSSVCMLLIKNVSVQAMLMCIHLFNSALNWSVLLLLVGFFCLLFLVWFGFLSYDTMILALFTGGRNIISLPSCRLVHFPKSGWFWEVIKPREYDIVLANKIRGNKELHLAFYLVSGTI